MRNTKSLKWIIVLLFGVSHLFSQKDSILDKIRTNGSDTSEAKKYITAGETIYLSDLKKASYYWHIAYNKSMEFSKNYPENSFLYSRLQNIAAEALNNFGYIFNADGIYDSALYALTKSLEIKLKYGTKMELSDVYNNIAFAQMSLGNYSLSISNHFKSLRIREELKNDEAIANSYLNIAYLYENISDSKNSRINYQKALEYYLKANSHTGIVNCLNSFAVAGLKEKKFEQSRKDLYEARDIAIKNNLFYQLQFTNHNIGYYYHELGKYDSALVYYLRCYDVYDSIGSYKDAVSELNNIAVSYYSTGKHKDAIATTEKALLINAKVNDKSYRKTLFYTRFLAFRALGKINDALNALMIHQALSDSLNFVQIREDAFRKQMQYEYDKKSAADSLLLSQQQKLNQVKLDQQKTVSYFSIFAVALLIGVVFLIFRNLRASKKNNIIISEQKHLVEEKNKEITDSINYAKRLQNAILTTDKIMKSIFEESFVLYKPKDIVSGDFYWMFHTEDKKSNKNIFIITAADCTGHGVPGAFMSMLNSTLLNQTAYNPSINTPADALNFLNAELPKNLRSSSESETINDGMDIAFCLIDLHKLTLKFAGANNPCWVIRNAELIELKPTKQAITASTGYDKKTFVDQDFQLQKGDSVYLFTDGYADQFGGPKGKKFKYKTLSDLLINIREKTFSEQKDILERTFNDWKGGLEQVDDVLILGFKI